MTSRQVLLVGTGPMAMAYAKVLAALGRPFVVVGRGSASGLRFHEGTGIEPVTGGLDRYLCRTTRPHARAIVAVGVEDLEACTESLLRAGAGHLLVEKPGAFDLRGLARLTRLASSRRSEVRIAFNRRYYASTLLARRLIATDGGPTSFHFEFTEWPRKIASLKKPATTKANWLFLNSTHVIDLAFFLGEEPTSMSSFAAGGLPWHPSASIFTGAGRTRGGAVFSYRADWGAPGRWSVEVCTRRRRFSLAPLERLSVQEGGDLSPQPVVLDDGLDARFKPGVFLMTRAFLSRGSAELLPTLQEHYDLSRNFIRPLSGGAAPFCR